MKDRIRQLMEAKRMNQQAFARFTKIGTASLSSIFTGRTKPTLNHVEAILEAFPLVNPTWLLRGEGPMMIGGEDPTETLSLQQDEGKGLLETAEGDLFNENSFLEPAIIEPATTPIHPERFAASVTRFEAPRKVVSSVKVETDNVAVTNHRITEIRVFYDNQTWESFVPKK